MNIERFEQLLASETLSPAEAKVISDLLAKEIEALAQLGKASEPAEDRRPPRWK